MAQSIANQQVSPSQILGRVTNLHRVLEEAGLPYGAWQVPINDPVKRRRLVDYWMAGMPEIEIPFSFDEPQSHRRVRELMGENFQGVTAAQKFLGLAFTEEDLRRRMELRLFDEVRQEYMTEAETLAVCEECRETHLMQATHPLSLIALQARVPHLFVDAKPWFKEAQERKWASVALVHPWQLIRKSGVPESRDKNVDAQRGHIAATLPKERSIFPVEYAYGALLHQSHTGKQLCVRDWVRFLVQAADGRCVGARWCSGRLDVDVVVKDAATVMVSGSVRSSF